MSPAFICVLSGFLSAVAAHLERESIRNVVLSDIGACAIA